MKRLVFVACLLVWHINPVQSGIIGTASSFTGAPASVTVLVDDQTPGDMQLEISVVVNMATSIGDLRGLFFHINDESLLGPPGGFSVAGLAITQKVYGPANSVINLGGGNILDGGGTLGPFDIGFEIGTPGIGGDDYQTVSFTLMHDMATLDLSLFANQDFGVRLSSVGQGSDRGDSSKLGGTFGDFSPSDPTSAPVAGTAPEPATLAIWSFIGICGVGAARRKRATNS